MLSTYNTFKQVNPKKINELISKMSFVLDSNDEELKDEFLNYLRKIDFTINQVSIIEFKEFVINSIKNLDSSQNQGELLEFYYLCLDAISNDLRLHNVLEYSELCRYMAKTIEVYSQEDALDRLKMIPENHRTADDYMRMGTYTESIEVDKISLDLTKTNVGDLNADQACLRADVYFNCLPYFSEASKKDPINFSKFYEKMLADLYRLPLHDNYILEAAVQYGFQLDLKYYISGMEFILQNHVPEDFAAKYILILLDNNLANKEYLITLFNKYPDMLDNDDIYNKLIHLNLPGDLYYEFGLVVSQQDNPQRRLAKEGYFHYAMKYGNKLAEKYMQETSFHNANQSDYLCIKNKLDNFYIFMGHVIDEVKKEQSKKSFNPWAKRVDVELDALNKLTTNLKVYSDKFLSDYVASDYGVNWGINSSIKNMMINEIKSTLNCFDKVLIDSANPITRFIFKIVMFLHDIFPTSPTVTGWMGSYRRDFVVMRDEKKIDNIVSHAEDVFKP